jgi:hypothetical protein
MDRETFNFVLIQGLCDSFEVVMFIQKQTFVVDMIFLNVLLEFHLLLCLER